MQTFGDLTDTLPHQILCHFRDTDKIHVVPDRYDRHEFIKGGERDRCSQEKAILVQIKDRATKLLSNLRSFLMSSKNKMNLIQFLISDWCVTMPVKITDTQTLCIGTPEGKTIWITHAGHRAWLHTVQYECDHKQANTLIFVDSTLFSRRFAGQHKHIIIFTPDTDVAVLCCHHFPSMGVDELWFHSPVNYLLFVAISYHEGAALGKIRQW